MTHDTRPGEGAGATALRPAAPADVTAEALGRFPRLLECPGPHFGGAAAERFVRRAAVASAALPDVILDLTAVRSVDALGLRSFARLARACRDAGGELRLCGAAGGVRALLAAGGLHELATVFATRALAEADAGAA